MNNGQRVIAVASAAEAATGLGLLAVPSLIVALLLGMEPAGIALVLSRVAGIALIALAIACWPGAGARESAKPYLAMLLYNSLVALVLAEVGINGEMSGVLLWPTAIAHFVIAILIAWTWFRMGTAKGPDA